MLFGFTVLYCGLLGRWFFVWEQAPEHDYWPVFLCIVVGGLLGARLAHVFFYDWAYFKHHPYEILNIWQGGLASHGGAIGMALTVYVYARFWGQTYYWWFFDRLAIGLPLGMVFIRLGNLFNQELFGKPTELPWAFVYSQVDSLPRHPVQLYEMLAYLLLFVGMMYLYLFKSKQFHFGTLTGIMLLIVNAIRFLIEFYKDSPIFFAGLNMAQWLCIPFMAIGILILLLSHKGRLD